MVNEKMSRMPKEAQTSLLERIKAGDTKAFDIVYRQNYSQLCSFAVFILHDRELAEEIVDDVMFYLWDHREEEDVTNLNAWLQKAIRNKSINALKSASKRYHAELEPRYELFTKLFNDSQPLETLMAKEMNDEIDHALSLLPEDARRVFVMCKIDGKKYAEVAEALGISVNTVKYHMKNAMKLMLTILKKYLLAYILLDCI